MDARRTGHVRQIAWAVVTAGVMAVGSCTQRAGVTIADEHDAGRLVSIFDGASLGGWVRRGGEARYYVEHGAIVGETRPDQPNSFLCTSREFSNFRLELEFLVDSELNSGVQIRSRWRPEGNVERVFGYQVEIDPSDRGFTAGLYDEARRGWIALPTASARGAFKRGDWNRLAVEASGARIRTWLNGEPVTDVFDGMDQSGFIALQVHGVGARKDPLRVRWRNIRLVGLE